MKYKNRRAKMEWKLAWLDRYVMEPFKPRVDDSVDSLRLAGRVQNVESEQPLQALTSQSR